MSPGLRPGLALGDIGGILLVAAVVAMPWFSQDPYRIAPVQIDADPAGLPGPGVLAQAPLVDPEVLEDAGERAEEESAVGAWEEAGGLGIALNLLIVGCGICAAAVATAAMLGRPLEVPPPALLALGALAAALVAARMLIEPDLEGEPGLAWGAFAALGAAVAIALGGALERAEATPPVTP